MGGITGFASFRNDFTNQKDKWIGVLVDMQSSILHRGKISVETIIKERICFSLNTDEFLSKDSIEFHINGHKYYVVSDGEIYNFEELKKDMISRGYVFEKNNCSEIILFMFIEYGIDFVNRINGVFAIAIFDNENFYLIRDRLGIKPLFYTVKDEILLFGSEIKSIFKFPNMECILDRDGISEIFALGPAHTQGFGIFKDIKEILPGSYLHFKNDNLKQKIYWRLESKKHTDTYDKTVSNVRKLVLDSIEQQSSKNIGALLSGGIDSSIVTAVANKLHKDKYGGCINTFSFDFTGNDKYFKANTFQPDQDKPWVKRMVDNLKTNHHFLEANINDLADNLFHAVNARDYPGMADIDSSLLYFCKKIGETNKVAFSGECADEVFGGYPWFHKKEMFEMQAFPWSNSMEIRKSVLDKGLIMILDLEGTSYKRYKSAIAEVSLLESENHIEKRRRELAYLNLRYFMMTLVDRMDRMSMNSAVTLRAPYSDYKLVEYVFNIPWEMKYKNNMVKHMLRKACEGIIPDELLYRKKSPYPKIYNPAYENLLRERLNDVISNNNSPIIPLIDKEGINKLLNSPSDLGKPWYGQLMAKPQMLAYLLQIDYWLREYNIKLQL